MALTEKEKTRREEERRFVLEHIYEIKKFRREYKGRSVSTSHTFTIKDFTRLMPELHKRFKTFTVDFAKDNVKVTISMGGGRRM